MAHTQSAELLLIGLAHDEPIPHQLEQYVVVTEQHEGEGHDVAPFSRLDQEPELVENHAPGDDEEPVCEAARAVEHKLWGITENIGHSKFDL